MKNKILKIGGHVSFKKPKYLIGSIEEIIEAEGNVGAIFVGAPQSSLRTELDNKMIEDAWNLAKENNIYLEDFVVHAPYIVNLAHNNDYLWNKSVELVMTDILRTEKLKIKYFNIHPGSNENVDEGINKIAKAINYFLKQSKNVSILLETTTSKGNSIGKNFNELKKIIDLIDDKTRIGVCVDTVHIWDAGYDIKNNINSIFEEFEKIIGIKYLKAMHISDSKNDLGSNKDRHENIGKGYIGLQFFQNLIKNEIVKNIPLILETPHEKKNNYKEEIKLIKNEK